MHSFRILCNYKTTPNSTIKYQFYLVFPNQIISTPKKKTNNMKYLIVLAFLVAVALAAPVDDAKTTVLRHESDVGPEGYKFEYETSDGVSRSESGVLKNVGTENEALNVRGTVTWTAADGQEYTLNYFADEDGFHPEGKHLPTVAEPKKVEE